MVLVVLGLLAAWQQPAEAGGPLFVGGTFGTAGVPFTWSTAAAVSYHTDQGTLGGLNTAAADALVKGSFDVWQNVTTANISFTRTGDLGMDINGSNHMSLFNSLQNCQAASTFTNAIVYDTDGSITEDLTGESNMVIGFAGALCVNPANQITRGQAVLNGKFIDGLGNPTDLSGSQFQQVFTHEFGHLIGLDHSQINNEVADQSPGNRTQDDLFGLPLMFPLLLSGSPSRVDNGFPPLAPDDEAWVSELYPDANFNATFGRIEGQVFFSDGVTPIQGTNLIARQVDNPATAGVDESRRFAVSSTSGYLFTSNPGQSVTGSNSGDGGFGSHNVAVAGFFRIPVNAGTYTLEVEPVDPDWTEGSRVGPLGDTGEQFPLPGPKEFWNQLPEGAETSSDSPVTKSNIVVAPGATVANRNIILNGMLPRFDGFETARLEWREPAPAWLRERRPPAFLVLG